MTTPYRRIIADGLWSNNVIFSQMLALCPLMAVTGTATNGLGMGLATTAVLIATGSSVAALRRIIEPEIRIPAFVLIIAVIVTLVEMAMNAWLHDLYKVLGLFIPLIVTNCAIFGRAEAFASREGVLASAVDGMMMGLGFTLALVVVGAVREILGSGTIFANASLLLGARFGFLQTTVIPDYKGFLLLVLPPGGFFVLGLLLAAKRAVERRRGQARVTGAEAPQAEIQQITL
ncbi:electron transport complex subunit E [Martelella endophytica]|uniref:Ion-translocating oxidoreductase complex subunit E n=1 Tax=Martelella endophytica TaxID=1486262 RepID=A0A0D5LRC7_MAREN|nr:electron transport complex subunit E [Martelella endophytica]AJY46789.1 electron transport complex RsxE subunit [Martelella endophytica]